MGVPGKSGYTIKIFILFQSHVGGERLWMVLK